MGCPEHAGVSFKLERVRKATVGLVPAVRRSLWRCAGSKPSCFGLPLAKEPRVPCAGLPAHCSHHVHAFLHGNHWLGWAVSGGTSPECGPLPSAASLQLPNHNGGGFWVSGDGNLDYIFKRWEWQKPWCKPSAYSLLCAAAHFPSCPLFVCTKTGSKRLKDNKKHKMWCIDVWMERFKRFCEVKQDHKTLRESFGSCIIKVTIQNTVIEVSLVPHLLCITEDLKVLSAMEDVWTPASVRKKKLLSIYICLIGLYKCKSSGLRNPTSHPHIAVILTVIISMLLKPTTDHEHGSFFCSLSTTLILMTDNRWAHALI